MQECFHLFYFIFVLYTSMRICLKTTSWARLNLLAIFKSFPFKFNGFFDQLHCHMSVLCDTRVRGSAGSYSCVRKHPLQPLLLLWEVGCCPAYNVCSVSVETVVLVFRKQDVHRGADQSAAWGRGAHCDVWDQHRRGLPGETDRGRGQHELPGSAAKLVSSLAE